jgi:predicted dehydrogenase
VKYETGGSILQVGGCHAVDGLRWFVTDEAVEVVALSSKYRPDFEQDTTITFVAKFKSGAMGKVCCFYNVACPYIFNLAKKKTIVDLDDAIKTFEIIEAADRSASSGGSAVKLPLGWA